MTDATKPVKIGPFLGMDNKRPRESLSTKDGDYVRDALNVDLTSVGTFQRRAGMAKVFSSARATSLWSSGGLGYFVDAGVLKSFDGTNAVAIKALIDPTSTASFTDTPRGIVWSDGNSLELISGGSSAPLSPPALNPVPLASASTGGALPAGTYTVAFANVDSNGVRSPMSLFQAVTVGSGGAIAISLPVRQYATQVFISAVNGTELYYETTIAAASTSSVVTTVTSQGTPADNEFEDAMPPGIFARVYRGRLLTVKGNAIFYSRTYDFGLTYPAKNFILLDGPVTLCEPTQTGVFVATADATWFLNGMDIATAELVPLAPYGAIPNTVAYEPHTLNMWWMTPRGMVRTTDANTLEMKQDEHLSFGTSSTGAAIFREDNGLVQVVSTLSSATPPGAASASSYMEATTVN